MDQRLSELTQKIEIRDRRIAEQTGQMDALAQDLIQAQREGVGFQPGQSSATVAPSVAGRGLD